MSAPVDLVVMVTSTLTATAAISTAGFAYATWRSVKRHERALYGSEDIAEWDGLVPKVSEHEDALEREDLL